ncbi:Hypothetical_protein [Hexamita inflata]|uniref:Hypothetical_protein n=1 Tax=Hexamita inflata TaxID=28002 RepID=A0ABP1J4X3_9EUKA
MTNYVIQVKQVQTCSSSKSREEMYQRQEHTVFFETFGTYSQLNTINAILSEVQQVSQLSPLPFFLPYFFTVFMNGLLSVCGEFFVNSRRRVLGYLLRAVAVRFIRSNRSYPVFSVRMACCAANQLLLAFAFITGLVTGSKPNGSTVVTGHTTGFFTLVLDLGQCEVVNTVFVKQY